MLYGSLRHSNENLNLNFGSHHVCLPLPPRSCGWQCPKQTGLDAVKKRNKAQSWIGLSGKVERGLWEEPRGVNMPKLLCMEFSKN